MSACAAEHHTWAEGACQADWGCALLDQLPRQGEGQGNALMTWFSFMIILVYLPIIVCRFAEGNGCSSLPCCEPTVMAPCQSDWLLPAACCLHNVPLAAFLNS